MGAQDRGWAKGTLRSIERWVPWALLAVVAYLFVALLVGRGSSKDSSSEPAKSLIHQGLSIQARSDRSVIGASDRTRQRLIFTNVTEGALTNLSIRQVGHPGFSKDATDDSCWQGGVPVCWSLLPSATARRSRTVDLAPGASAAVSIPLVGAQQPGRYEVVARVAWLDSDNQRQVLDLTAPSVEILTGGKKWARWLASGLGTLQGVIKDLALPLVILLLGFFFKSAESRRAEINEVWAKMLPKSHENAEKYHMPMCSRILTLSIDRDERDGLALGDATDSTFLDRPFWRVMSFWKGMIVMKKEIGGIYLKDQDAEQIIADLWKLIFLRSRQFLPDEPRSRALEAMEDGESFAQFQARFRDVNRLGWHPKGDFEELARGFRAWLDDGFWDREFFYLWALRLILRYESNRPHERWYGSTKDFPWQERSREVSNRQALEVALSGLQELEAEAGERCLAYFVRTTQGQWPRKAQNP